MGWFRRTKQSGGAHRKPTLRETRAAERTAKAETVLQETEHRIHQFADQVRDDLKGSASLVGSAPPRVAPPSASRNSTTVHLDRNRTRR